MELSQSVDSPGSCPLCGVAYLVCCHFAEDDGESLVEPEDLYLAGKNAVYGTKDAAMAFMQDLEE